MLTRRIDLAEGSYLQVLARGPGESFQLLVHERLPEPIDQRKELSQLELFAGGLVKIFAEHKEALHGIFGRRPGSAEVVGGSAPRPAAEVGERAYDCSFPPGSPPPRPLSAEVVARERALKQFVAEQKEKEREDRMSFMIRLFKAGFDPVEVAGSYGTMTPEAIERLQALVAHEGNLPGHLTRGRRF